MERKCFLCKLILIIAVVIEVVLTSSIDSRYIKIHDNKTINSEIKAFHQQKVSSQTECSLLCQQNKCFVSQSVKKGSEYICSLYHYIKDLASSLKAFEGSSEIFKLDVEVRDDCLTWYEEGHTGDGVYHVGIEGNNDDNN